MFFPWALGLLRRRTCLSRKTVADAKNYPRISAGSFKKRNPDSAEEEGGAVPADPAHSRARAPAAARGEKEKVEARKKYERGTGNLGSPGTVERTLKFSAARRRPTAIFSCIRHTALWFFWFASELLASDPLTELWFLVLVYVEEEQSFGTHGRHPSWMCLCAKCSVSMHAWFVVSSLCRCVLGVSTDRPLFSVTADCGPPLSPQISGNLRAWSEHAVWPLLPRLPIRSSWYCVIRLCSVRPWTNPFGILYDTAEFQCHCVLTFLFSFRRTPHSFTLERMWCSGKKGLFLNNYLASLLIVWLGPAEETFNFSQLDSLVFRVRYWTIVQFFSYIKLFR